MVSNSGTPKMKESSTPKRTSNSPQARNPSEEILGTGQKNPEEVEELSDMMCSLMTNKFGETRFIGLQHPEV